MAERLVLRRVPSQKSSAPELYQYQYEPMTQAERAFKYRQNLKKDPKKLMAFREKEKERKKKQRRERTKEQIIKDNLASKERQKRYRERQKQKGIKPNKSSASASVLTREKRQKQREYWRIKQRESRSRRTSQKIRRIREKDLKNWHNNKKTHIKKTYRPQISAKEDFFKQTSEVFKEIVKEKKARNMLVHRFSFLKKYGLSKQLSKYTGVSESIISRGAKVDSQRKTRSDATSDEVKNMIQDFMQRPEVSTSLPSSKRVKKDNIERKVLDRPVKDLHSEFKDLHPNVKISLSTFKRNRPENIESTRKQYWEGCLCEVCENVENKLKTLNNLAVKKECSEVKIKDKYEAVGVTMCEKQSQFHEVKCINRQCMECGVDKIVAHFQPLAEKSTSDEVTYTKWERVKKNVAGKEVVRVMPITKTATIISILIELSQELETLSRHLFVASWQQKQFTTLRKSIPEGTVILNMDFAENFSCVAQNEVQAAHWGHEQVTIHPTVSYYNCPDDGCDQVVTESLIFISPDKVHDSHAVNTFTQIAVEHLKEKRDIDIQRLIEMTDGCSSQYKSKIPFTDISCSMIDYGFPTERHFYGSRHGKGPSDGAGAVVKSFVRRGVMGGNAVVNNAEDFYEYAKKLTKDDKHSKRTLFYTSDIDRNRPERTNKKTLVGTRKLQCVKTIQKDKIATRNLSCFCQTCLKGAESEGCENHAYVDGWTAYELQSAGAATRVGDANNGTRVRVRGRQNQLRVGARTRSGIVRHGESRPIRNRVAVRTRGGVGVRQGDGRPGRTIVRGRTRGRGNARYRPDQESTSSSDQEESFDSDSSSDQGEVSDSESSLDQGESEDLNHCRDSYIAEQTEKVETDEEEFSDIADIADISGINTILDYLQSEEVNLQFDNPQSLIQVQEEDDNYKAEGILKTSTDIPPMENDNRYHIGDYLMIRHGCNFLPAVVVQGPADVSPNKLGEWVLFFSKKNNHHSIEEKLFFVLHTDIISKLNDPQLKLVGSRVVYDFQKQL